MLKRHHRISKNALTADTASYRFIKAPYFSLKQRKNDLSTYRFAFVISKKIDKRAVVRNTLKRRMSSAVSPFAQAKEGYDMVFFLKKDILQATQAQINQAVLEIFKKQHTV
jgi:ribonuclease P protein component